MVLVQTRRLYILRQEVEKVFGQKVITSSDCYLLADDIYKKTKVKLSFNTLRRFFQLMDAAYPPSVNTIHVFIKYCGFSSEEDFDHYKQQHVLNKDEKGEGSLLAYLDHLFKNITVPDDNDATFIGVVQQTIDFIKRFPALVDAFQQKIAKTENGQKYYFEKFINIDKLNFFYGDGLRYYLIEKQTAAAQLLGNSLLCLKGWLTEDEKTIARHYKKIEKMKLDEHVSPSVRGHYFAAQLFYADYFGGDKEVVLIRARQYYSTIKPQKNSRQLIPYFEINFCNALVLSGLYEEALFYVEEVLKRRNLYESYYNDWQLDKMIGLYQAISLANLQDTEKAREIFSTLCPSSFYFLSKQYLTILYLQLKQLFQKRKAEEEQLQFLIKETGFCRLMKCV